MARKTRRTSDTEPAVSWWEHLSPRIQHAICLVLLLAVSVGFFAPMHFSGKQLIGGDTVQWRGMAESVFEYERATGETGLWAPNAFAGMPAYMISYNNQIPQVDDVPRLLRKVIWPTSHFFLLLLGVYLLVFFLTRRRWTGVLGAVAFGLTTYLPILLVAGHNTKFIALCFAPWLALAFIYALRRPRLLSALLFAIAFAANLRAGHPQITYYAAFMLGIWWIVEAVAAYRRDDLASFGKATAWLVLGTVLGLLMVAQPYLVNFEYKDFTMRGVATTGAGGGMDLGYAFRWSQGPLELLTLLISGAFGGSGGLYWGPKPFTAGPHYVGGIVVLLALLALWRLRRPAVWGLGAAILLMVLFALGRHVMWLNALMYEYFPFFDAFRAPETWLSMVALALAVLAGLGAYYLTRPVPTDEVEDDRKAVYGLWGGLTGLVVLLLFGSSAFFSFERPDEEQQIAGRFAQQIQQQRPDVSLEDPRVRQVIEQRTQQIVSQMHTQRADVFADSAWRTLIFLLLAGALIFAFYRQKVPGWVLVGGLALLVVVDLWGVGRQYLNEDRMVRSDSIAEEIPRYDFDDYLIERRQEAGGKGHFRILSFASGAPMNSARASYFHESLGGYHGAKLGLYQDFIDYLFRSDQTGLPREKALDMLNTRYIVAPRRLPGTRVAYEGEQSGMLVLENPDVLPRAFFVGKTKVIPSATESFEYMASDAFDPHETVVLHAPVAHGTTPITSGSTTGVELQEYSAHELVWQVQTGAPRLLVVSEVYYPAGWTATIDGEAAPILRANHFLRAVPVPAGEHTVRMTFAPQSHTVGLWVSGLSTLGVYGLTLVLLGMTFMRRRREDDEPSISA